MPITFCTQCGTRLVVGPVEGKERPHCPACGFIVYRNPVPVGMAVVERDGRLLLIRRGNPPLEGYWAPPAGHVEIDESVPQATTRETREEAGVDIELEDLLGVFSEPGISVMIVAYRGRVVGGDIRAGEDAVDVGYFAPGELPARPEPVDGTPTDRWFHGVLESIFASWKASALPHPPTPSPIGKNAQ